MTSETPTISGNDKLHPLAQSLVVPVQNHAVACARPPGKDRIQQEWAQKGAGHGSDRKRRNTDTSLQQQPAHNGAEPVDQRRYCLYAELPAHQQNRAKHSARKEAQLCRQQNAREA